MTYEYLRLETADSVAKLTLCRPERANALNLGLACELHRVAQHCRDTPQIRAVVIAAEGRMFCAGGDLASFAAAGDALPDALRALLHEFHSAIQIFSAIDAPVICAVSGTAAGGALGLIAASNLAYATADSKFTMAFTAAGLTPDSSSTFFLPRLIGWRRCEELMLTNRVLSGREAVDWGLLNACYDDAAALDQAVDQIARRLASGPTRAFGGVRRLLMASAGVEFHEQLAREGESIVATGSSADGREGISAFLAKRKPQFAGR